MLAHQVLVKREAVQSMAGVARGGTTDRPPRSVFLSRASLSTSPIFAAAPRPLCASTAELGNKLLLFSNTLVYCFRFLVDDKARTRTPDERTIESV